MGGTHYLTLEDAVILVNVALQKKSRDQLDYAEIANQFPVVKEERTPGGIKLHWNGTKGTAGLKDATGPIKNAADDAGDKAFDKLLLLADAHITKLAKELGDGTHHAATWTPRDRATVSLFAALGWTTKKMAEKRPALFSKPKTPVAVQRKAAEMKKNETIFKSAEQHAKKILEDLKPYMDELIADVALEIDTEAAEKGGLTDTMIFDAVAAELKVEHGCKDMKALTKEQFEKLQVSFVAVGEKIVDSDSGENRLLGTAAAAGDFAKERFFNVLAPWLDPEWKDAEVTVLIREMASGRSAAAVARDYLPNKSGQMARNRYNALKNNPAYAARIAEAEKAATTEDKEAARDADKAVANKRASSSRKAARQRKAAAAFEALNARAAAERAAAPEDAAAEAANVYLASDFYVAVVDAAATAAAEAAREAAVSTAGVVALDGMRRLGVCERVARLAQSVAMMEEREAAEAAARQRAAPAALSQSQAKQKWLDDLGRDKQLLAAREEAAEAEAEARGDSPTQVDAAREAAGAKVFASSPALKVERAVLWLREYRAHGVPKSALTLDELFRHIEAVATREATSWEGLSPMGEFEAEATGEAAAAAATPASSRPAPPPRSSTRVTGEGEEPDFESSDESSDDDDDDDNVFDGGYGGSDSEEDEEEDGEAAATGEAASAAATPASSRPAPPPRSSTRVTGEGEEPDFESSDESSDDDDDDDNVFDGGYGGSDSEEDEEEDGEAAARRGKMEAKKAHPAPPAATTTSRRSTRALSAPQRYGKLVDSSIISSSSEDEEEDEEEGGSGGGSGGKSTRKRKRKTKTKKRGAGGGGGAPTSWAAVEPDLENAYERQRAENIARIKARLAELVTAVPPSS